MNSFIMSRQLVKRMCDETPTSYVYHPVMNTDFSIIGFRVITTLQSTEYAHILAMAASKFQHLVIL